MQETLRRMIGEQRRPVTRDPRDLSVVQDLLLRGSDGREATLRPAAPVTGPTECDGEPGVMISVIVTAAGGTFVASPHWFRLLDTDGGDFPARLACTRPVALSAGESVTMDLVFPDVTAGWLTYGFEPRDSEAIWSVS